MYWIKTRHAAIALAVATAACTAQAQSSVEIFGRLDIGVSAVSNAGGGRLSVVSSGVTTPTFIAFRGSEDLGGGTRAVFLLQQNFDIDTGGQTAALAGFAANAYVGLANDRLGTLTVGRQKDFTLDMATQRYDASLDLGGIYALRGGPFGKLGLPLNANGANWDRLGGFALSNAVKYVSPSLGGLTLGGLYAFGETAGSDTRNGASSLHARYGDGPWSVGATYTSVKFPSINNGDDGAAISTAGGRYTVGNWRFNTLYSKVRNTFSGASVQALELGAVQFIAPWTWGLSMQRLQGNAQLDNNRATQVAAQVSYYLSKRTALYALAVTQRTNAGAKAAINTLDPSSTNQQSVLRLGITTSF